MKIKIAMVVEAMLGGIRQHVCDIVKNLDQDKYDIYLIYSDIRADDVFFQEREVLERHATLIQCNEMQREIGRKDLAAYHKLVTLFREIKPEIVHCHSSKAGIVGRLAAKKCKVKKIIYTPNAYSFQSPEIKGLKKDIYILAERVLSRYATTMTINVSKGEMKQALDYKLDKPEKFTLIYNGIPDIPLPSKQELRDRLGLKQNAYYVGVTARCAKQKDPMTFLRIAEQVVAELPDTEFIYIGDGPMQQEMEEWIKSRKLEERIHMLGFRTDASEIVGALDIYLSTALYEGLPYSMIEAMRAGVPIIATDVVGNKELIFDGKNGKLFSIGNIDRPIELIKHQKGNMTINSKLVKDTYNREFSLNYMMKKVDEIYNL